MQRTPKPPFTRIAALAEVRAAEERWNERDPQSVALASSPDSVWRNREETFQGRAAIEFLLRRRWAIELHHRLVNELWAFSDNRISVRCECEWRHAVTGQWYRSHSNEHWEFDAHGYMTQRDMSANDIPISPRERRIGQ